MCICSVSPVAFWRRFDDEKFCIPVCGEALSHCVKYTVNDIIEYIPEEKLYILDDCSSPVTGFEEQGKAFLREMEERGANIVSSDFVIENF